MKSIIVGGGKIGYYLFKTLIERKYDVVMIENNKRTCELLAEDFDAEIIFGDGTDIDVLKDSGINDADVVVAVTGTDEENLVICKIAKASFNVPKTIARINNPKNTAMFKALGVDKTVCSTSVIANLIEYEFDHDEYKILQTFERGAMILVEVTVDNLNTMNDRFLKDLDLPDECVVTSILRDEKAVYPRGNTRILENDSILFLTSNKGLHELKHKMKTGVKK